MIVLIPCSGKKLEHEAPAVDLYIGSYYRACLDAARALVPDDRILIVSAKHGLVDLHQVLEPYEQRIDEDGAVTVDEMEKQFLDRDLGPGRAFCLLLPTAYATLVRDARRKISRFEGGIHTPLAGCSGIGEQLSVLKGIRVRSSLAAVGSHVSIHEGLPKTWGRPLGKVKSIGIKTAVVEVFYDGSEHRVPVSGLRVYQEAGS